MIKYKETLCICERTIGMDAMDFKSIKDLYTDARQTQKKEIIDWLLKEGFTILTMSGEIAKSPYATGSGKKGYSANSSIKPYDLRNWKWISARKANVDFVISLQAFDIDPKTHDRHMLMDRIGVYTYHSNEYSPKDCFEKMDNTGIDLPMTAAKYTLLKNALCASTHNLLSCC
ncbi:MAG: hypothetical protein RSG55_05725 [Oscillospiraceae bacterium]